MFSKVNMCLINHSTQGMSKKYNIIVNFNKNLTSVYTLKNLVKRREFISFPHVWIFLFEKGIDAK